MKKLQNYKITKFLLISCILFGCANGDRGDEGDAEDDISEISITPETTKPTEQKGDGGNQKDPNPTELEGDGENQETTETTEPGNGGENQETTPQSDTESVLIKEFSKDTITFEISFCPENGGDKTRKYEEIKFKNMTENYLQNVIGNRTYISTSCSMSDLLDVLHENFSCLFETNANKVATFFNLLISNKLLLVKDLNENEYICVENHMGKCTYFFGPKNGQK